MHGAAQEDAAGMNCTDALLLAATSLTPAI